MIKINEIRCFLLVLFLSTAVRSQSGDSFISEENPSEFYSTPFETPTSHEALNLHEKELNDGTGK